MTGSSKRRSLSEEERALWSMITRTVTPLKPIATHIPDPESVKPAEQGEGRIRARARSISSEPAAEKPLASLGRRLRQRLARGSEPLDRRIDLHGLTQVEAHEALARFLREAQAEGARTVLVVTGKGMRRGDGEAMSERGVLRRLVPLWLREPSFRPYVLAIEPAHAAHGGTGAFYVRLRRPGR
jgi:DNA-nicking Smr family endonuclease